MTTKTKTAAKHTPGPWRVATFDDQLEVIRDFAQSICSMCRTDGGANARLIAAAPELAEACRRLTKAQPCNCRSVKVVAGPDAVCDSCFGLAALEKAGI